jgi:hypothetical protein
MKSGDSHRPVNTEFTEGTEAIGEREQSHGGAALRAVWIERDPRTQAPLDR